MVLQDYPYKSELYNVSSLIDRFQVSAHQLVFCLDFMCRKLMLSVCHGLNWAALYTSVVPLLSPVQSSSHSSLKLWILLSLKGHCAFLYVKSMKPFVFANITMHMK